ncbi:MAG TPA: DUF615 domain-containing protein [Thiotrichales bacterium]|nr:DUF615 domain-containing protein [Thiotrichales bacterium]
MHSESDKTEAPPSKTRRKREADALQALGETLVGLPEARLAAIELPDRLREAVMEARRIKARGGRRRQLQYIGKLMRSIDADPIRAALDDFTRQNRRAARAFRQLEALRDQLIAEGDAALGEVLERFPHCDRQHLRQLMRQARKDQAADKTAGLRALFRYLRELSETAS